MGFIETYNECEKTAIGKSTFTERKIFSPFTHNLVNDPTRIASISELPYFVCTMHNQRAETTVNKLLNGLTEEEADILRSIVRKVSEVSSDWGIKTAPFSSVLRHLYQRRLIRYLLPDGRNFLEIGPGSGYLSLMLALDGKAVCNTDVTQAYYIFQHYLYDSFGLLSEFASTNTGLLPEGGNQAIAGKVNHLPWWIYKDLPAHAIAVDVIIVNHAICEMHAMAVQHLLAIASRLGYPKFFMESTGLDSVSLTFEEVKSKFLGYGYSLTYSKNDVYVFEHEKNSSRGRAVIFAKRLVDRLARLIPFITEFKKEFQRLKSELSAIKRQLTGRVPEHGSVFQPNPVCYDDVLRLYEQILGERNFMSLDEEFLDRVKAG